MKRGSLFMKQEQKQEQKTRAVKRHATVGRQEKTACNGRKAQALRLCNNLLHKLLCNSIPLPRHVMKEIETEEGLTVMRS